MNNLYDTAYNKTFDIIDFLKYDVLNENYEAFEVPNKIAIRLHTKPNFAWLESPDYPGLFASGENPIELWECMNDAIYSYFGVPRHKAKKLGNVFYLPLPDGRAIVERPREQLAGA